MPYGFPEWTTKTSLNNSSKSTLDGQVPFNFVYRLFHHSQPWLIQAQNKVLVMV